ncbi:cell division protein FtsL [Vibrio variabilis]|uniref:Cell division protein FtsL n=1 Tax=Vibrio variabilis TaxID=990271 RepID=A0ABR4Y9G7_9VIBR|nr:MULTISPECIES: cell division protein FtsL [Vibrio]KHA60135.1 cell division protein FtsL [Vibrio variabilis]KHT49061.1 cell division protein FtsL [Vibrio sinaloensis]
MSKSAPNLAKIIALDLITVGRVPLVLLVLIFASAMGVVFTTHHTRQAITEKDQALMERERLDNEWRNLLLEETALAEHSRVQAVAKQELEMMRPESDKEVIIQLP